MEIEIYSGEEIQEMLEEYSKETLLEIIDKLDVIGIACMNEAKQNGDYQDHTQNLRNSIEYAVVYEGKIVRGGGKQNEFLLEAIRDKGKGTDELFLVLAAGMEYASYVEFGHYYWKSLGEGFGYTEATSKPYNVIASAELLMDKLVNELYEEYS